MRGAETSAGPIRPRKDDRFHAVNIRHYIEDGRPVHKLAVRRPHVARARVRPRSHRVRRARPLRANAFRGRGAAVPPPPPQANAEQRSIRAVSDDTWRVKGSGPTLAAAARTAASRLPSMLGIWQYMLCLEGCFAHLGAGQQHSAAQSRASGIGSRPRVRPAAIGGLPAAPLDVTGRQDGAVPDAALPGTWALAIARNI